MSHIDRAAEVVTPDDSDPGWASVVHDTHTIACMGGVHLECPLPGHCQCGCHYDRIERERGRVVRTPEEVAREALTDERVTIWEHGPDEVQRLADLIRARDAEVRAEALAQVDEFAILLAATREGLARSGSKAKGVQQVVEMLADHAGSIYTAAQAAHYRQRPPWREDRGKAASEALSWKPEPNRDQEDR